MEIMALHPLPALLLRQVAAATAGQVVTPLATSVPPASRLVVPEVVVIPVVQVLRLVATAQPVR